MSKIQSIIEEAIGEDKTWKDGNIVSMKSYSSYTDEGGSEIFSVEPDYYETGIILGNRVFGKGLFLDFELSKEDFVDGKWVTGVDENGAHDVYEYAEAEIIENSTLADLRNKIPEIEKKIVEEIEKEQRQKLKTLFVMFRSGVPVVDLDDVKSKLWGDVPEKLR